MTSLELGLLKYVFPGRFQLLVGTLPRYPMQLAKDIRPLGTSFPLLGVWCVGSRPAWELLGLSVPSWRAPVGRQRGAGKGLSRPGGAAFRSGPPARSGLSYPCPTQPYPRQAPAPAPDSACPQGGAPCLGLALPQCPRAALLLAGAMGQGLAARSCPDGPYGEPLLPPGSSDRHCPQTGKGLGIQLHSTLTYVPLCTSKKGVALRPNTCSPHLGCGSSTP